MKKITMFILLIITNYSFASIDLPITFKMSSVELITSELDNSKKIKILLYKSLLDEITLDNKTISLLVHKDELKGLGMPNLTTLTLSKSGGLNVENCESNFNITMDYHDSMFEDSESSVTFIFCPTFYYGRLREIISDSGKKNLYRKLAGESEYGK